MGRSFAANEAVWLLLPFALACKEPQRPTRRDAAPLRADATLDATDVDAAIRVCPSWTRPVTSGRGWLYAQVESASGSVLTAARNNIDVYIRQPTTDRAGGIRADANDPCAVGSYDATWPKVTILAAAVGFSTRERDVTPVECTESSPCTVILPPRLPTAYYASSGAGSAAAPPDVRVLKASEVPAGEKKKFAAAIGEDAIERSKALKRPLATELEKSARVSNVPARELAIEYTEAKLGRSCDMSCLNHASLDDGLRTYLRNLKPGQDPFKQPRIRPDRWNHPP